MIPDMVSVPLTEWEEFQKYKKTKRPHVGLGVMVVKNGRVPIGQRTGSHGQGYWAFPGGHNEFMETWFETAEREVLEENDIIIKCKKVMFITENLMKEDNKHYNTIFVWADYVSGDMKMTPESKINPEYGWVWVTVRELMARMPQEAIRAYEQGNWHDALHWFPLNHIMQAHREMGWEY